MSDTKTRDVPDRRVPFGASKAMGLVYRHNDTKWPGKTEMLLLRRAEHVRMFSNMWGPPAGGLEPKKDYSQPPIKGFSYPDVLLEAVVRETLEETGLIIPKAHWRILAADGFHHQDGRPTVATFFYAPYLRRDIKIDSESTDWGWFSLEGIRYLDERNKIIPGVLHRVEHLFRIHRMC